MRTARGMLAAAVLMISPAACAVEAGQPVGATDTTGPSATTSRPPPSTTSTSRADAIREWETRAGEHFKESADALERISESSSADDEAGLRVACQRLHDTNSVGLQSDLPTPDRNLTNELQRMIDDMNTAAHACLRFALARNHVDAGPYRVYLGRAVAHLERAKRILNALKK